jgi:hypothetical protein
MRKTSTVFVFATMGIAICSFSTMATAQSQPSEHTPCPAGYWQMQSVCLNDATGDVVNAEPAAASPRVAFEPGCPPGYWRLDSVCLSSETGDVELVDENRWRADQRVEPRK